MPSKIATVESGTDGSWRARCELWRTASLLPPPASPRRREQRPLILCGHGISLRIEKGTLLIRDGFTHFPQERAEHRIFPGEPTRPTRIIVLDGSGSMTFDVIDWLREQDIALIRIDWRGSATVMSGGPGYTASGEGWKRQVALLADPKRRLAAGRNLIQRKLERSLETLATQIPETESREYALDVIAEKLAVIRSRRTLDRADLLGIEGRAAKVYFNAWSGLPILWRAFKRHPIPAAWRTIGQRQSMVTGKKGKNRDASHPVNAMLNYAYAVLESQVRLDVLAQELDPQAGFLHSGYRGAPALVLDLMEPLRPAVDAAILGFVAEQVFTGADFTLRSDGVVRLNPQLARRVAGLAVGACGDAKMSVATVASGGVRVRP